MANNNTAGMKMVRAAILIACLTSGTSMVWAETPSATSSPEQLFGLKAQQEGAAFLKREFDGDAFYKRVVATLPTSEKIKQVILQTQENPIIRKHLYEDAVAGFKNYEIRFLGVRQFEGESEVLFRAMDHTSSCYYAAYVTGRAVDGSVKLVDVHSFGRGELMSQTFRREALLDIAAKQFISGEVSARDKAYVAGAKEWIFFVNRVTYGKVDLIQQAYDKLPAELQNDRGALARYARTRNTLAGMLIPIRKWRQLYPEDPCPEEVLLEFYWSLYLGSHEIQTDKGLEHVSEYWTPEEEDQASATVDRANVWLQDPALVTRLARYFMEKKQDFARAKLIVESAIKQFPQEYQFYDMLVSAALREKDYDELGKALHIKEVALKTNLTASIDASPDFAAFRKSLGWKRWQHDIHGMDLKTLTPAPAK